ncbi:PLD nuclease N-terminal domain-containing protein [Agromyces arachidis]|uniref:PLD nuclease N-terminal domain-containing protein n=1 Tax=Agromyces arachidis TaxID=766966 RepID=UPI004056F7D3
MFGIPALAVCIAALIHIGRAQLNDTARAVWALVVLLFPFVGGIVWWSVGARGLSTRG